MSALAAGNTRPGWVSKSNFEALAVESGEESEGELVEAPLISPPDSSSESAPKLSKSAIKKAKEAARLERQQQKKAARAASRLQAATGKEADPAAPPRESKESSRPRLQPPADESDSVPSVDDAPAAETNGSAAPTASVLNGHAHDAPAMQPLLVENIAEALPTPLGSPKVQKSTPKSGETVAVTKPPPEDSKPKSNGDVKHASPKEVPVPKEPPAQDAEQVKKRSNVLTRTLWTFIMIGGFITLLLMGHVYMIILVQICQALVYREVTSLFLVNRMDPEDGDKAMKSKEVHWNKTLNWYFFAVTNYFLYGESIIYYFKHIVFSDAQFTPFAMNHRMISFTLYTMGFVGFVLSLKRGYLKQQFASFCWVHMTLLFVVLSSHFIVNNILEGLIWFWVPASLVICNDVFAYIWGITIGHTPLIKLSPKKTVEGFVGAFFSTLLFGVLWGTYFMQFDYMTCPVRELGITAFSDTLSCKPNPVFVWTEWEMWAPLRVFLSTLLGRAVTTIPYAPYQIHLLFMSCFASLVAPFGGFFASGLKRAFNIKDFGHSIPGHGGMTDRMDCQFLMGVFTYVYFSSLIREHNVTVGSALQMIVSGLTTQEQLELIADLKRYLEGQGIAVPF